MLTPSLAGLPTQCDFTLGQIRCNWTTCTVQVMYSISLCKVGQEHLKDTWPFPKWLFTPQSSGQQLLPKQREGTLGTANRSLSHPENGEEYLMGLIMGSNILYPPNHHWSKFNRYLEATALYLGKILSISNTAPREYRSQHEPNQESLCFLRTEVTATSLIPLNLQ